MTKIQYIASTCTRPNLQDHIFRFKKLTELFETGRLSEFDPSDCDPGDNMTAADLCEARANDVLAEAFDFRNGLEGQRRLDCMEEAADWRADALVLRKLALLDFMKEEALNRL